eukprot:gene2970-3708_t
MLLGLNIDMIILVIFLLANVVVGLFSSKRISSLYDYAVGGKDFSTATLTATVMVSWIGGMYVFEVLEHTYRDGLYFIIIIMGACLCLWLVGLLAVRMHEFLNNISVAEAMGDLYGKSVQIVSAISGVLCVVTVVAIEFKVISRVVGLIFDVQSTWITGIAAFVIIGYSIIGGIRSITFTDIIQFFTFGMFIPILALVIWNQLKDPQQVISLLNTHPNFSWSQVVGVHPKFLASLGIFLWFIIPGMDPVIFQRVSMARDVEQVKRAFGYASLISIAACLFLAWVAILALASNPNLEPQNLFEHIINNYATGGLRGFISVGVLALAMSTADSYLHASAILLTNDIAKPLGIKFIKKENEVLVARLLCLLAGLLGLAIALRFEGILALLQFGNSLYMPVVTVPLLFAILGFRSTGVAVLIGMGSGFSTVIIWHFLFKGGDGIIPGIVANVVGLLGSHYVLKQPGGWIGVREPAPLLAARSKRQKFWKRLKKDFKEFSLMRYLQKTFPTQEYAVAIFGLYALVATYAAFHTIPEEVQQQHEGLYRFIGQSALFVSTGLLTYPMWPAVFKKRWLIIWLWPLSVFYSIFVVGTWLIVMSNFHTFQTMIFLLSIVMAFLLFDWPLVVGMIVGGIFLAMRGLHWFPSAPILTDELGTLQFKILYGLLLLSSFLLAIFKHKAIQKQLVSRNDYLKIVQAERDAKLKVVIEYRERFANALSDDCVEGFLLLYQRGKELLATAGNIRTEEEAKAFMEDVVELFAKQQQGGEYLSEMIYRFKEHMCLDVRQVDLVDFLDATLEKVDMLDLQPQAKVVLQVKTKQTLLQCDPRLIQKLIYNGLQIFHATNQANQPIQVIVEDAYLVYDIPFIPDYVKKLPAIQFIITTVEKPLNIQTVYEVIEPPANILMKKQIESLAKLENDQIMGAHYGYWEVDNPDAIQTYVIPVDIRRRARGDYDRRLEEAHLIIAHAFT